MRKRLSFFPSLKQNTHIIKQCYIGGKAEPDVIVGFLLEADKIDPSWTIHHLLFDLVPTKEHPHVPEESRGVHEDIANIWLAWGKLKGYS